MTTLTDKAFAQAHGISDAPEWLIELIHNQQRLMSSNAKSVADQVWYEFHHRGLIGPGVEENSEEVLRLRQMLALGNARPIVGPEPVLDVTSREVEFDDH